MEFKERTARQKIWSFLLTFTLLASTANVSAQASDAHASESFRFPNMSFNCPVVFQFVSHYGREYLAYYNIYYKASFPSPAITYKYDFDPPNGIGYQTWFYQDHPDHTSTQIQYHPGSTYPIVIVQDPPYAPYLYSGTEWEFPIRLYDGRYVSAGDKAYYEWQMIPVSSPPTFTLSSSPANSTWTKATTFHVSLKNIVDPEAPRAQTLDPPGPACPGVDYASAVYQIDGGPWTSGSTFASQGFDLVGLTDGTHVVKVTLADLVGNVSPPVSITLQVDSTPPTGPSNISLSLQANPNPTDQSTRQILASWSGVADSKSGVANVLVYVDPGTGSFGSPSVVLASQQTLPIPITNQAESLTYRVAVVPVDALGNRVTLAQAPVASLVVPPLLALASVTYDAADSNNQSMNVALVFNLTPSQFDGLSSTIQISRTSSSSGAALPPLNLDPTTIPANINTSTLPWRTSGNYVVYVDSIPVSSGAGHKSWLYKVVPSLEAASGSSGYTVTLPSNASSIGSVSIIDSNNIGNGQVGFGINASRVFAIQFQAIDPDQDNLTYEVASLSGYQDPNVSLTTAVNLTGQLPQPYPYSNGYEIQKPLVTLAEGDNFIQVKCNKGLDQNGNAIVFSSDILEVKLKKNSINGYFVTVVNKGKNIGTDDAAITTRPGQVLSFNIAPAPGGSSDLTFTWQYDDPNDSTIGSGPSVAHVYTQVNGQASSTVNHSLVISVFSSGALISTVSLTVQVVDTTEGPLLVPERWTGPHVVLGVVTVPASLSLDISPDASVTFQGDLADGFGQGIEALGSLSIGDRAIFSKTPGQAQGWGTITVTGTATFGTATVQDANHGLTVTGAGNAILHGTTFTANRIGIDVVGNGIDASFQPAVAVYDANIFGNRIYGIKTDAGAKPTLSGTRIGSNFRNYYSFDQGLLDIKQINDINKQAAVPNSGDTNWGLDNAQ